MRLALVARPSMRWRPSRYNFTVRSSDPAERTALFNTSTGALTVLEGEGAAILGDLLLETAARFSGDEFDPELLGRLRRGGFLILADADEVDTIRQRFWRARDETPVVLTVTTTMDCNLGCYYCYEERSRERLEAADIEHLVSLARSTVRASRRRALHVDWYGGEPLLNLAFIETASKALQAACASDQIAYSASIISNGSLWPEDVEGFVARHRIRQVQISFDGLRGHHDKRRRYRREHRPPSHGSASPSSFERAVSLVDRLVQCVRVDLRYNIDRGNREDVLPFLAFVRARGWFSAPYPAVFQPARLASYSSTSRFLRASELPLDLFDAIRAEVRADLGDTAVVEESEVPDGFPYPKTSVCAALANHSVVVGADRKLYRCGLQVGEAGRSVAALEAPGAPPSANAAGGEVGQSSHEAESDAGWWHRFDPTTQPTCSVCSFLPICWGGCPKKHLERDQHALREQGRYWRTNLPRLIAEAAGFAGVTTHPAFDERLQFRVSPPAVVTGEPDERRS